MGVSGQSSICPLGMAGNSVCCFCTRLPARGALCKTKSRSLCRCCCGTWRSCLGAVAVPGDLQVSRHVVWLGSGSLVSGFLGICLMTALGIQTRRLLRAFASGRLWFQSILLAPVLIQGVRASAETTMESQAGGVCQSRRRLGPPGCPPRPGGCPQLRWQGAGLASLTSVRAAHGTTVW